MGGREGTFNCRVETVNLPTDVHAINNLTVLLVTALPVQCCGVPNPLHLAADPLNLTADGTIKRFEI